ncbi:hypothetical protein L2090_21215 [Rahnella victoriana]|nr:hypothetical protein [Rahnella victoriana]
MREEFEKWFDENMYLAGQCFCTESEKRRMLKAWTASRSAIEIDLPQRQSLCASGYGDGYFVPSDAGEGLEYDEVVEAITSHGIRIKGKKE